MVRWTKEEVEYLKKNYSDNLDKELSVNLKRSLKSISYIACKLKLKKDIEFYARARKRSNIEIKKEDLEKLYLKGNSMRKIAKKLGLAKTTIEYYFKKFNIMRRTISEANKAYYTKESNWLKGLSKDSDPRIKKLAESVINTYKKKRKERFRQIEELYGKSLKEIITTFYWKENLTQEKIAKKLNISRRIIIQLMKELKIAKRPNFEFIASLKGKNHSMYGKTWDKIHGLEKSSLLKKQFSEMSRTRIIRRLHNKEMPFLNTLIERLVADELKRRGMPFESQFVIDHKFVCDFAIPPIKIIIECDGDYWHANPKIYNHNLLDIRQKRNLKNDNFKNLYLSKQGWKVFRFFESDIKSSVEKCINQIPHLSQEQLRSVKNPLDSLNEKKDITQSSP